MSAIEPTNSSFTPSRPLIVAALAWAAGILLDRSIGSLSLTVWWPAAIVSLMTATWFWYWQKHRCFALSLVLSLLCIAGSWHRIHWHYFAEDEIGRYAPPVTEPVCLEAVTVDAARFHPAPPDDPLRALPAGETTELVVRAIRIRDGQQWQQVSGNCRLRVTGDVTNLKVGDRVQVFGRFRRMLPAMNPGQFDWSLFGRGAGRFCDLYCQIPACVNVVEPAAGSPLSRVVDHVRGRCEWRLTKYVGEKNSALAKAVLLGAREELSADTDSAFLRTGTVHLLVVSGLHVGMVALVAWILVSTGMVPRRWGLWITALLVLAYAAITGARPPVIRASVLVLLGLLALIPGRRVSIANLLAVAALVILIRNPADLFQSGTQLSFLCVMVLAGYGHFLTSRQRLDPLQLLIREAAPWYEKVLIHVRGRAVHLALISGLLWLAVAPLVAYHFHITTPVGILLTPILWPLLVGALTMGLAICSVAWIVPPLANVLGGLCSLLLGMAESIVKYADSWHWGSMYCAGPQDWWITIFYLGLASPFLIPHLRLSWKWQASLAASWVACGLTVASMDHHQEELHCTFLSMGHGTCVVLELPGNQTVLYDAGSLGSPSGATNTVASYLWSRGITRLDAIVLSHADVDHYNAVPGLLERFDVEMVYVSPMMFDPWSIRGQLEAPELLRQKLAEAEVPLQEIWMNDRLRLADSSLEIEVLHPSRYGTDGRDNANSIVLLVRYAGHSILLPGDLESPGLEAVTSEEPLDVDLLLAPHHGSVNSDPPGFAAWCTPEWTVISGPRTMAATSLTETSYRKAGSKVLHTSRLGATRFTLSNKGISIASFLDE